MQGLLMEARSQTDDWHYPHLGDLNFWFFMVVCHLNPQEFIRVWHDDADKLVGYAILGEDPSFDCQVLPEYEWCGIETEAISWAETRRSELRGQDAQAWSGNFVSGVRQDNLKRISFLEQHGFQQGDYTEVNMICSLTGLIPKAVVPTGCKVCSVAEAGDISDRAAAHREVWHPYTVGNVAKTITGALCACPAMMASSMWWRSHRMAPSLPTSMVGLIQRIASVILVRWGRARVIAGRE